MTNRDDLLLDLDAALDVAPSATFAEGVRVRVAQSRSRTRQMWWGLAAAASVTLATVIMWRPAVVTPVIETPVQVEARAQATVSQPLASGAAAAGFTAANVCGAAARAPRVKGLVTQARRTPAVASEPRFEVITNQPELLRQMWAEARARALPMAGAQVGDAEVNGEPKAIAPIAVDPIVVAPILVSEIGTTGGRGGATPSIRRVDAAGDMR